jgi:hypothetical protein
MLDKIMIREEEFRSKDLGSQLKRLAYVGLITVGHS